MTYWMMCCIQTDLEKRISNQGNMEITNHWTSLGIKEDQEVNQGGVRELNSQKFQELSWDQMDNLTSQFSSSHDVKRREKAKMMKPRRRERNFDPNILDCLFILLAIGFIFIVTLSFILLPCKLSRNNRKKSTCLVPSKIIEQKDLELNLQCLNKNLKVNPINKNNAETNSTAPKETSSSMLVLNLSSCYFFC